jgi:hypothetical protein
MLLLGLLDALARALRPPDLLTALSESAFCGE